MASAVYQNLQRRRNGILDETSLSVSEMNLLGGGILLRTAALRKHVGLGFELSAVVEFQ